MCCESQGSSNAPVPQESEFSKTLAQIMRERQDASKKYEPLENQLIGQVQQFSTPDYLNQQLGKGAASVNQAFGQANAAQNEALSSMGVNPADGRFAFMKRGLNLGRAGALTASDAGTRDQTRRVAFDALAGVSGRGDAKIGQAIQAANSGGQQYLQGQQNQMNWQNQQSAADAAGFGGLGSLFGTAGMLMLSSRKLKRGVRGGEGEAMARARKMPVKNWRYLKGVGDGGAAEHTGPMAEDAAKAGMSDGKMLNVADVAGTALGAAQNLDKRLRRLEGKK